MNNERGTMNGSRLTPESRIYVAGHQGMVGSAIVRTLQQQGYRHVITRSHADLDLCNQAAVQAFFQQEQIDVLFLAAAKVGGILANNRYPAEFIFQNLIMECNVIHAAYGTGVGTLLFLGSSCIYPKNAQQPMKESALMTGTLEPTNEPYAIAKIAGIKLCESYNRQYDVDYRSVMPTNLYGPNDNFHRQNSHVIPAMIRRFHEAKMKRTSAVVVWGTGRPRREFLHVDDLASACLHVMRLSRETYCSHTEPMLSHINVGAGTDVTIEGLAEMIRGVVDYRGEIVFDSGKPDGAPRKLLDVSKLQALGWTARIPLDQGLKSTYEWYVNHSNKARI